MGWGAPQRPGELEQRLVVPAPPAVDLDLSQSLSPGLPQAGKAPADDEGLQWGEEKREVARNLAPLPYYPKQAKARLGDRGPGVSPPCPPPHTHTLNLCPWVNLCVPEVSVSLSRQWDSFCARDPRWGCRCLRNDLAPLTTLSTPAFSPTPPPA